jgi:hypothetical protein
MIKKDMGSSKKTFAFSAFAVSLSVKRKILQQYQNKQKD